MIDVQFTPESVMPAFPPGYSVKVIDLNGAGFWQHRGDGTIEKVVITLSAKGVDRQYFIGGALKGLWKERDLFRTETRAQEELESRNREEKTRRAAVIEKMSETSKL